MFYCWRRGPAMHVVTKTLAALGCLLAATGCPREPEIKQPVGAKTVRVRAITDASAIRILQPAGEYMFAVGPHGLDRWDPQTEQVLPLSADHGLPGDVVLALGADVERMWLWLATDGGLGYYDVSAETFAEVPPSPMVDVTKAAPGALHLAAAADGGVWIGHPTGLYYTNTAGQWADTPITGPVSAVGLAEDGWLWAGTTKGLVGRNPKGDSFRYGPEQGCEVTKVRLIARAPGGGVLVVGEADNGKQRLAVRKGNSWTSMKISPDVKIEALAQMGDGVVAMGGHRLYGLGAVGADKRRLLTRDGVRLLAVGDVAAPAPSITIELLPATLPTDTTAIAALGSEIFVGTRDIGIARWKTDGQHPEKWLRRREILADATTLTVACKAANDCWLATGTRRAWHYDGDSFEPSGPEAQAVLAVVRRDDGTIYALHRAGDAKAIDVSRVDGAEWTPVAGAQLETPGDRPEVSFARFSPGANGVLWIGLRYTEGLDQRPWGVAIVDVDLGAVAYHHATSDKKERKQGVLPVPTDVVDGAFVGDDEVWFATSEGAARLIGNEVTVWNEATGMASELVRAIAVSDGGFVFVATGAGVGAFDGESWSFPRELSFAVNDLAIASDGKLWMATDRGMALYDGKKVKRLDTRRGLLENELVDIAIDEYDRVWARGAESLTLVSP